MLASTNNAPPGDGVTVTPKHVGAVVMLILRKFTYVSVGEWKKLNIKMHNMYVKILC